MDPAAQPAPGIEAGSQDGGGSRKPDGCEAAGPGARGRPAVELGALLRRFAGEVLPLLKLNGFQKWIFFDLMACRTREMGGHLDRCKACGLERPSYDSCRNRHCPLCQGSAGARWVEERMKYFLPTHCFHTVFTVPAQLRPLFLGNMRPMYELLFQSVSGTLKELCNNPKWLGATPGFTLVLHSWAKDLNFHPHIHGVITGGGLRHDGGGWKSARGNFLLPVRVMSALFRGKFLAGLSELYTSGALKFAGKQAHLEEPAEFKSLLRKLYNKGWVVYAKKPFASPEKLYRYLSRYTHRVALTNWRILGVEDGKIRLRTRGDKSVLLSVVEFFRRFSLHILPLGFRRIRHYGLFASANLHKKRLDALAALEEVRGRTGEDDKEQHSRKGENEEEGAPEGLPLAPCPRCGARMSRSWVFSESCGSVWKLLFGRWKEKAIPLKGPAVLSGSSG